MLEDQLFLVVGLEHHGILVERPDAAGQLDAAEQVNGDVGFSLRAVFRKVSCMFCAGLFSIADLL